MGDVTLLLLHETTSRTLARAWSSIWDGAIPLVLLANTMFSGSSVISPAVIGTHLMTCHGIYVCQQRQNREVCAG